MQLQKTNLLSSGIPFAAILLAALGYFVDVYDLLLFSIIRVNSLQSLGLTEKQITEKGIVLLNMQMTGLMIGGVLWGILGDKKGRLTVLFGSIFIYSAANIANGFVSTVEAYALCRFIAGLGLAGELGAGITLVAELMPARYRGYATCFVAVIGISGAVVAFFTAKLFDWRMSYYIGGALGVVLLLMRISVAESAMFVEARGKDVKRGSVLMIIGERKRLLKYVRCILIGLPLWYVVGVLISLSPEFGKALKVNGIVNAGIAVALCYGGSVLGGTLSGLISQYLQSRIKAAIAFTLLSGATVIVFFAQRQISLYAFYTITALMGIASGYWALFVTMVTEQFGTNVRATVSTTVPNFVRGAVVPMMLLLNFSTQFFNSLVAAGILVGVICFGLALLSLARLKDTFWQNLNYLEK
ncbi:MFS transporter [Mucilaginibacter defluvii]|uniref:MFS transporter n=1 Tax=Mucilaginibacter defluvii TaxID=1196019 RepID=A0ABP9G0Z6_9SPHI